MNQQPMKPSALAACLLALALSPAAQAQTRVEVVEVEGVVEHATGPAELMRIDADGRITVRALRGFGLLPEPYAKLALDLRGQGVDLLSAGPAELKALIERAEAGSLKVDPQPLHALLELFERRDFYAWQALQPGESLELGGADFIRGDGRALVRDPAGPVLTLAPGGRSGTTQEIAVAAAAEPSAKGGGLASLARRAAKPLGGGDATAMMNDQPGVADGAAVASEAEGARIWSDAPGMRLFDRQMPDLNRDIAPHLLATVAPTLDGGYVVAGSVQAGVGQSVWVASHDSNGMLRWSRSFGGAFDLYAQAVGATADGGVLVVGSLGEARPGFVLALDPTGALRWSRVSDADWATRLVSDNLTGVAANAQGLGVAVGQARNVQSELVALALAVPPDGSPGWRLELADSVAINAVIAHGDGWLVAGQARSPHAGAWVGRIDSGGNLDWQRTYGEDNGGAARAMTLLADGRIAITGQTEGQGEVWLRLLDSDGALAAGAEHALDATGAAAGGSLLGMATDDAGGLWLSGMTGGNDGWLARLDAEQKLRWVRVYGGDADDALKAVVARPNGAVAVGVSESGGRNGARSLWVVSIDDEGMPVADAALSESALKLKASIDAWAAADYSLLLGGAAQIVEASDGAIRMVLPFARMKDGLPLVTEVAEVDVGELRVDARPTGSDGRWQVVVDLPASMAVRDVQGNELGTMDLPSRKFHFDWLEPARQAVSADIAFDDMSVRLDGKPGLEALHAALGMPSGMALFEGEEAEAGLVSVKQVQLGLNLSADANGRWAGPLRFTLADWRRQTPAGDTIGRLGGIRLSADYADMDLIALGRTTEVISMMLGGEGEPPADATPQSLVADFLNASGSAKGELVLSDIEIGATNGADEFRLGELSAAGFVAPSSGSPLQRDFGASYKVKGLGFRGEGNEVAMASLDWDFSVERLAIATIVDLAAGFFMGAPQSPEAWPGLLSQLVGGVDVRLATTGTRVTALGAPPANVESMHMRLALSSLDTPAAEVNLEYAHDGFTGAPEVPPEVLPRAAAFDLGLTGLPVGALLAGAMEGGADPLLAIMTLAQNAARLNIRKINLDMPIGGLLISGIALAEAPKTPDDFPLARLTADIEVRNLDAIVNWMASTVSEDERKNMLAGAAVVKLAGIEEKRGDGTVLHRFAVVASSEGELTVNGKDLAPLLAAGEEGAPAGGVQE